jgi:hypothetical protein
MDQRISSLLSILTIIFYSLLASQILIAAIVFFLTGSDKLMPPMEDNVIAEFGLPAIILIEVILARFLSDRRLEAIKMEDALERKLETYRFAFLLKMAMLEGANLLALVGYLLTQSVLFLAIFLLILVVFTVNRPTGQTITASLGLSGSYVHTE